MTPNPSSFVAKSKDQLGTPFLQIVDRSIVDNSIVDNSIVDRIAAASHHSRSWWPTGAMPAARLALLAEAERLEAVASALERRAAFKRRLAALDAAASASASASASAAAIAAAPPPAPASVVSGLAVAPVAGFRASPGSRVLRVGVDPGVEDVRVGVLALDVAMATLRLGTWRVSVADGAATFLGGVGVACDASSRVLLTPQSVALRGASRAYVPAEALAGRGAWRWDGAHGDVAPPRQSQSQSPASFTAGLRVLDAASPDAGAAGLPLLRGGDGCVGCVAAGPRVVVGAGARGLLLAWDDDDDDDVDAAGVVREPRARPPRAPGAPRGDPAPPCELHVVAAGRDGGGRGHALVLHALGARVSCVDLDTMGTLWDAELDLGLRLAAVHVLPASDATGGGNGNGNGTGNGNGAGMRRDLVALEAGRAALRVGSVWPAAVPAGGGPKALTLSDVPLPGGGGGGAAGSSAAAVTAAATGAGALIVAGAADGSVRFLRLGDGPSSASVVGDARPASDAAVAGDDPAIAHVVLGVDSRSSSRSSSGGSRAPAWAVAATASGLATVFAVNNP